MRSLHKSIIGGDRAQTNGPKYFGDGQMQDMDTRNGHTERLTFLGIDKSRPRINPGHRRKGDKRDGQMNRWTDTLNSCSFIKVDYLDKYQEQSTKKCLTWAQ
jgi:hypothetical protein